MLIHHAINVLVAPAKGAVERLATGQRDHTGLVGDLVTNVLFSRP